MFTALIIALIFLAVGGAIGYVIRKQVAINQVNSAESKAEKIITDAKAKESEILLQTRDKAIGIIDNAKKDEEARRKEVSHIQQRVERREALFDQKLLELQEKQQKIQEKAAQIDEIKASIQTIKLEQLAKLERIAELTREQAKNVLLENVEREAREEVLDRIKKIQTEGSDDVAARARSTIVDAMQRCAMSVVSEVTTSTVALPSDEMKGRIIGKEGRNIKTLENLTGVEIIIDDTPQAITLSSFSLIRRQVAKITLEKLIKDGRIHPGRIEDYIEQAKQELAGDIKKAGEDALFALGVTGIDPRLIPILGRLKYRASFGQNALLHSMEVAYLSAFLAEEVGADVAVCRKGGLFHDIGKAVDHEVQGSHPQIGYDILKKFNFPEEVAYMCIAHHEDSPHTLEGIVVKVGDALSASRPGARRDTVERYIQRISELEGLTTSFAGVEKAYAIQAGREIRIFVRPDEIDDMAAYKLAKEIAKRIEEQLQYPGELKVTLIREKRIIEYAK